MPHIENLTTGKKSILIIDDSSDLLEAQQTILEMEDFIVFTALSGTEAFELLTQIDPPDLIILDVQMEDMSGPDFLNLLEKEMPKIINDVPIVFLTGMEVIPSGKIVGFIKKPFDLEMYLEEVYRFIDMKKPYTLLQ